ncbi:SMR family transporter [Mycolicibacterium smegmatis]|nr:SMR family transporter [Mycolicibacterium smegmatis]MDF1900790.1 SMR family transporter [Mycolicibacterium smegmatis]MDF1907069.1 SMR family transporter [Mycolicibacterium smegmatis]MDF1919264.1 SMR family transporter [Mycolicibacterium smegmatis]MDF1925331.1 SMR family transporter [Mycolicibacterium smegmatis]UAK52882.1 QacE family quaternary ammonium compound efflux SMR transporter [Mycolicibacterium smegmatis]
MMWFVLGAAIVIEVGATLALRASEGFRRKRWIAPVLSGYAVSLSLLWVSLSLGMPVGVAYGVWTACGVALVAIVARFLFNDPLTMKMAIGITFIVSGVLAIELAGVPGLGAS